MSLFTYCSQCGRKCLSFLCTSDGLCGSCRDANQVRQRKEMEQQAELLRIKHEEDIANAENLYNDLAALWANTGIHYYPQYKTLEDVLKIIADCDMFVQLLNKIPEHPCFQEVFAAHCSNITATSCSNKDFGNLDLVLVDSNTAKLDFDQLSKKVDRCREQAQKIAQHTQDFQELLRRLNLIEILTDPSATVYSPKSSGFLETKNITARTSLSKLNPFFSIDIETTGLNPLTDEIIQLTAIKFINFEPVDAFTTYIKPRNGIKPRAQAVNSITEQDVENAPYIESIVSAFSDFIDLNPLSKNFAPIVGHNLSFDFQFLRANGFSTLHSLRNYYDTLELSKREYKYWSSYKLDYLAKTVLNIVRTDAHDSLSDALATGLLFKKICKSRIGF